MSTRRHRISPLLILFALVATCVLIVAVQYPPGGWYTQSARPSWHPPDTALALALIVSALLTAPAAWLVWRRRGLPAAAPGLFLWTLHWTAGITAWWLMFGLHRPGWALAGVALWWALIAATMLLFHGTRRLAAWLMLPHLAMVSLALVLNYEFWRLNGGGL